VTHLDEALAPAAQGERIEVQPSLDGATIARLVDDGHVGALELLDASKGAPVGEPIWLYNRRPTPPVIDARRTAQGRPPLLSEVYTSQRSPEEAPPPAATVTLAWDGDRVSVTIDGELWAVASRREGTGWSKLIVLAGRHGRPMHDLDRGEHRQTITLPDPQETR
jgi:hypothetical protein